jgi:type II secretory pathway component PulJ
MPIIAGLIFVTVEAIRKRLLTRLEPTLNLHWAAYCGSSAQHEASVRRERTAQSNYALMARDWRQENDARRATTKQNEELRRIAIDLRAKLDLLLLHSNSTCLETWRAACAEQGLKLSEHEN